jgi:hypothetical protein
MVWNPICILVRIHQKTIAGGNTLNSLCQFLLFFKFMGWGGVHSTWYVSHYWTSSPGSWSENWLGKRSIQNKPVPMPLNTTNPTLPDPGLNLLLPYFTSSVLRLDNMGYWYMLTSCSFEDITSDFLLKSLLKWNCHCSLFQLLRFLCIINKCL